MIIHHSEKNRSVQGTVASIMVRANHPSYILGEKEFTVGGIRVNYFFKNLQVDQRFTIFFSDITDGEFADDYAQMMLSADHKFEGVCIGNNGREIKVSNHLLKGEFDLCGIGEGLDGTKICILLIME